VSVCEAGFLFSLRAQETRRPFSRGCARNQFDGVFFTFIREATEELATTRLGLQSGEGDRLAVEYEVSW